MTTREQVPGAELVVVVADLLRRPGNRRDLAQVVHLGALELSTSGVPATEAVELTLVLESIPEALTVTGSIRTRWSGECRRCLEVCSGALAIELRAVFEATPEEGETYALSGESVDLEPAVREAILLELPLAPLCSDDCRGPVPEAFDDGDGDESARPPVDPRWAALDALFADSATTDEPTR